MGYHYFKENYKMIAIDLSKQQALDPYPRAIQQISFTGNVGCPGDTIETEKRSNKNCIEILTRNCKSFVNLFCNNLVLFNIMSISNDSIQYFKCKAIKFTA